MPSIPHQSLPLNHLLAMPDKDYMNEAQLEFFRQWLEKLREELARNATRTSERLRERDESADPADRATQEEERTLELRARDRERKLLKKIEAALQRIEQGTFGYCEETGEPIGIARLYARPIATLCIEAQERHERRERQFSD
ncbi:RNA polymerase-binding transcription factor DksA [Methylophilaceae bacterium]|nr:RNA polymerase-binding transcription factor DksA [Methylophilaceae bacterium]